MRSAAAVYLARGNSIFAFNKQIFPPQNYSPAALPPPKAQLAGCTSGILPPSHLSNNRYRMVFLLSPRSFGQDLAYINIKYVVSNLFSFTNLFHIHSKRNKTGEVFDQVLIRFGLDSNFLITHSLYPLSITSKYVHIYCLMRFLPSSGSSQRSHFGRDSRC